MVFVRRRRAVRRRPAMRKRGGMRKMRRVGRFGNPRSFNPSRTNFARSTETAEYEDLSGNTVYGGLVTLNDFPRSKAIAQQYQWYRITAVKYIYEPLYNVFQEQQVGSTPDYATVPQFLWIVNRGGRFGAIDKVGLEEQGARPVKFTSNKIVKYKPNTLVMSGVNNSNGETLNSVPELKWNAWLPTDASGPDPFAVPYYGHQWLIDQAISGSGEKGYIARLTVQVTVEFKQPMWDRSPLGAPSVPQLKSPSS